MLHVRLFTVIFIAAKQIKWEQLNFLHSKVIGQNKEQYIKNTDIKVYRVIQENIISLKITFQ